MPSVNGYDVPEYIPANQVMMYFPQGVLGLQKLEDPSTPASSHSAYEEFVRVPVYLSSDGSLRLESDGVYVLPHSRRPPSGDPTAADTFHHVGRTISSLINDGTVGRVVDTVAPHALEVLRPSTHSRQTSGASVAVDIARHVAASAITKKSSLRRWGWLVSSLFDIVPSSASTTSHDDGLRFLSMRRGMLGLYLAVHAILFFCWCFADAYDEWMTCDCITFGLWRTCTSCRVNGTAIGSNETVSYTPMNLCLDTQDFSSCNSPSLTTIVALVTLAVALFGISVLIILIDLIFRVTPKVLFYPLSFTFIWSVSFAAWLMMLLGETTTEAYNLTKLQCEAQSNAANVILQNSGIALQLVYAVTGQYQSMGVTAVSSQSIASGCTYGPSIIIAIASWGLYSLIGMIYFYWRYSNWSSIDQVIRQPVSMPRPQRHRHRSSAGDGENTPTAQPSASDVLRETFRRASMPCDSDVAPPVVETRASAATQPTEAAQAEVVTREPRPQRGEPMQDIPSSLMQAARHREGSGAVSFRSGVANAVTSLAPENADHSRSPRSSNNGANHLPDGHVSHFLQAVSNIQTTAPEVASKTRANKPLPGRERRARSASPRRRMTPLISPPRE